MVEQDECLCLKAKNKLTQEGNNQYKKHEEKLNATAIGYTQFSLMRMMQGTET